MFGLRVLREKGEKEAKEEATAGEENWLKNNQGWIR
jgi:hypothetical protein